MWQTKTRSISTGGEEERWIEKILDKTKNLDKMSRFSLRVGGDLLSHTDAVSLARQGLTSLFGMGRGAPLRNSRHKDGI